MFRPFVDITWKEMKARIYVMGRQNGKRRNRKYKIGFHEGKS